jgi:hypothetical protein
MSERFVDDRTAISAADGTMILWDLERTAAQLGAHGGTLVVLSPINAWRFRLARRQCDLGWRAANRYGATLVTATS